MSKYAKWRVGLKIGSNNNTIRPVTYDHNNLTIIYLLRTQLLTIELNKYYIVIC